MTSGCIKNCNILDNQIKVSKLSSDSFDNEPTAESKKLLTSGAIKTALDSIDGDVDGLSGRLDTLETWESKVNGIIPNKTYEDGNELADKNFVNSSIATNTATYRGAFNLVDDLHLSVLATQEQISLALSTEIGDVADNNDYCFVQVPTSDEESTEIKQVDRYKLAVGVDSSTTPPTETKTWTYEYTLNNSGFTAAQWAAINSGITMGGYLTLDDVDATPTAGSTNPVSSGGVKSELSTINSRINGESSTRSAGDKARLNSTVLDSEYDANGTYSIGDTCTYNSVWYKCKVDIPTKEAWNSEHWEAMPNIKSQIDEINIDLGNKADDADVVHKSGDEMTGPLTMKGTSVQLQSENQKTTVRMSYTQITRTVTGASTTTWTYPAKGG